MLYVRKAEENELDRIMEIYASARKFMAQNGNPDQWGSTFPPVELIREDLCRGRCMAVCEGDRIHGVFAPCFGEEPSYRNIYEGEWLNSRPYLTIHRIAGDGQVPGIFNCALEYCRSLFDNIRIDTHQDNLVMQHLIDKSGFTHCGTIYLEDGAPRVAYQWSRPFEIRPAREEDCGLILHFIRELAAYEKMSDEVVATEDLLREWIFEKKKAQVLFPCVDGEEIGFALFFHNFSTFLGRAGIYLEDLFIRPEYRGRGYGKAALKRLAAIAEEEGCGRLDWACLDWNQPSIDAYLSMGARPMSEWTGYRLEGPTLKKMAE